MKTMKITKISLILGMFLTGALLFASCSKEGHDPDPIGAKGAFSATVLFNDTKENLKFDGAAWGTIGASDEGKAVVMYVNDKKSPAGFWLMLDQVKKGKMVKGQNDITIGGFFQRDSTQSSILKAYHLGSDNFPEGGSIKDAATFNITSISNDRIKGTFTATMVKNTTIYEDGELISGEIKTLNVTDGKFDIPLFDATRIPE